MKNLKKNGAVVTPINDITTWLKTGGISKQYSYTTIEQVIADSTCTESLMNNENAMTYLGQSAYVDDTVLNSDSWISKISSSNTQHSMPWGTFSISDSVSEQSFECTIDRDTTDVYVMPEGALYWYGNECEWITGGIIAKWNYDTVKGTFIKNTNSIFMQPVNSGGGNGFIFTNNEIDFAKYTKITYFAKTYTGSTHSWDLIFTKSTTTGPYGEDNSKLVPDSNLYYPSLGKITRNINIDKSEPLSIGKNVCWGQAFEMSYMYLVK